MGFPGGASGKEPACQCRRPRAVGLIPGSGRSLWEGNGNPFQLSCLAYPMDRGATVLGVTKSRTLLKWLSTMENSIEIPQKIGNRTIISPSNPTCEYTSNRNEIILSKRYLYPRVHCSIVPNSQDNLNVHQWMNGKRKRGTHTHTHTHTHILFSQRKKKETLPLWYMDGHYTKWAKSDRGTSLVFQ